MYPVGLAILRSEYSVVVRTPGKLGPPIGRIVIARILVEHCTKIGN